MGQRAKLSDWIADLILFGLIAAVFVLAFATFLT